MENDIENFIKNYTAPFSSNKFHTAHKRYFLLYENCSLEINELHNLLKNRFSPKYLAVSSVIVEEKRNLLAFIISSKVLSTRNKDYFDVEFNGNSFHADIRRIVGHYSTDFHAEIEKIAGHHSNMVYSTETECFAREPRLNTVCRTPELTGSDVADATQDILILDNHNLFNKRKVISFFFFFVAFFFLCVICCVSDFFFFFNFFYNRVRW